MNLFASLRGPSRKGERRILFVCCVGSVALAWVVARLWEIQIARADEYAARAREQYEDRVEILPDRGRILDRYGDPLAVSVERADVLAYPRWVAEPAAVAATLARFIDTPVDRIEEMLTSGKGFQRIKREATVEVGIAIDSLNLPGIDVAQGKKRIYPAGDCLAEVVGKTDTEQKGIEGIELSYDKLLQGQSGYRYLQKVNHGRSQPNMRWGESPPKPGESVVLTIDTRLQRIVKYELDRTVAHHRAKKGLAVALDPNTGEILSMAASCGAEEARASTASTLNLITGMQFEPGSTFKLVPYGAALEHALFRRSDLIDAEGGTAHVGSRTVRDVEHLGLVTLDDAFIHSSNVCAAKVGLAVGDERFYRMARAFGFGTRTGVDFPGEVSGSLPRPRNFSSTTLATLSFGYEVNVTALQLACAYAAVANGGILYEPHIVKKIVNAKGKTVREAPVRPVRRVVSEDTARILRELMQGVVAEGTAKGAFLDRWAIAGKTGTAKKTREGARGYDNRYVASFAGFFPAWDPKLVLVVVIDEPREGEYYGGAVAAPAFREMVSRIVSTASIPIVPENDRLVGPEPKWTAKNAWDGFLNEREGVRDRERAKSLAQSIARADSAAIAAVEANPDTSAREESMRLALAGSPVPDVTGMTVRRAMSLLADRGHEVQVRGRGVVIEQIPAAGSRAEQGSVVVIVADPHANDTAPAPMAVPASVRPRPLRSGR
ncbi:MAG: penicillin-binding protein [bacterium]